MSDRLNKDWLDSYLLLTENSEPPKLFRLWTGISIISSVLQRKCFIQQGNRQTFPNIWVVLVGPPATGKGQAMSQGYLFLEKLKENKPKSIFISADSCTRQALIKSLIDGKRVDTDLKTHTSIMHSSHTIFSEEFTVFTGFKDLEFLAQLTNWFDNGRGINGTWDYKTITRKTETIVGMWVNLLGGTTTTSINVAVPTEGSGTGFFSRIIFVQEDVKGKSIAFPSLTIKEHSLENSLYTDLEDIYSLIGRFTLTEVYIKRFEDFYDNPKEASKITDPRFAGYNQRRAMHIQKLSIICCAARSSSMIIDLCDFEKALNILQQTEKRMAKTFSSVGRNENIEIMNAIFHMIQIKKKVSRAEILTTFSYDIEPPELEKIMTALHIMKKVIPYGEGTEVWYKPLEN